MHGLVRRQGVGRLSLPFATTHSLSSHSKAGAGFSRLVVKRENTIHCGSCTRLREQVPLGEITIQLQRWRNGDTVALSELTPLVYNQLRSLARAYVSGQKSGRWQATELVNQLFVELLRTQRAEFKDRQHFFAFSARVMRQILAHEARALAADKRGGGRTALPLEAELAWVEPRNGEPVVLDLETAFEELERLDPVCVRVIELRYLFGFTAEETAEVLETSRSTVDRDVRFGLTWLRGRLHPE